MRVRIEAGRAIAYETARVCDYENNYNRLLERNADALSDEEKKLFRQKSRNYKKLNAMLTPMSKYYCSEMSISVATDAIQAIGGSGYMQDYPAERFLRDARVTTLYEGTSQLQIVAAIRGVTSGIFQTYISSFENKDLKNTVLDSLREKLIAVRARLDDAIAFARSQGVNYVELRARKLLDAAIAILIGHLLLDQATSDSRKQIVAEHYIRKEIANIAGIIALVEDGSSLVTDKYLEIVGPVEKIA